MRPLTARLGPLGWVRAPDWPGSNPKAPAVASDGRFDVGFDGRLDNRSEAWRRVEGGPPPLADAEVALASWRALGDRAPTTWRGCFAAIVLDRASGRAWLTRDAVGTRGLAYGKSAEAWSAASFPHWVARDIGADLDRPRLANFVALRDPPPGRTFFARVREVLPGQTVCLQPGHEPETAWQDPGSRFERPLDAGRSGELAQTFRDLADRACRRALGEVEGNVALLFSGGLDSTTLATSLAAIDRPPIALISWTFDSFDDERAEQEVVARELGLRWEPLRLDGAVPLRDLDAWPIHPSTPEQTPFRELHEEACRRAAELGAQVLLWGYGGDSFTVGAAGIPRALLRRGSPLAAARSFLRLVRRSGVRSAMRENAPPAKIRSWQAGHPPTWLTREAADLLSAATTSWPPALAATDLPRRWRRLVALDSMEGDAHEAWFAAHHGLGLCAPLRDGDLVRWALERAPLGSLDEDRRIQRLALQGRIADSIRVRPSDRPTKGSLEPLLRSLFRNPKARSNAEMLIFDGQAWPELARREVIEDIWRRQAPTSQELLLLWTVLSLEVWRRSLGSSDPNPLQDP